MADVKDSFKRTTISLRPEEYETLRFIAFKQKTSVAGVVRQMIFERLEDEVDIKEGLKALQETEGTMDWVTFKKDHLGL